MTQITKAQMACLTEFQEILAKAAELTGNEKEEAEALSTLLAIGDKLASGDWVMVPNQHYYFKSSDALRHYRAMLFVVDAESASQANKLHKPIKLRTYVAVSRSLNQN